MSEPKALTPDQRRAAGLIAQGRLLKDVAETLRVSPKSINRWSKIPEFADLVRRQREALFPAGGVPTAEGALLDALSATRPDVRLFWLHAFVLWLENDPVLDKESQEEIRAALKRLQI